MPGEIAQLPDLRVLRLQHNALTELPALTWPVAPDTLDVRNNALTFADLEPNLNAATSVRYAPQAEVPTFWGRENGASRFFVDVDGTANSYQWYRNGVAEVGAVAAGFVDAGPVALDTLFADVTNSLVPGLTLTSTPVRSDAQLATMKVEPDSASVLVGKGFQYNVAAEDQFGNFLYVQPQWMAGGGTIDSRGYFTAGEVPGFYTVIASGPDGLVSAEAVVEVFQGQPTSAQPVPHPASGFVRFVSNYPNPFRSATTLMFEVSLPGAVRVQVFDALGRLVSTLVDKNLPAGSHKVEFFAGDRPSGLYFVRLQAHGQSTVLSVIRTQ